MKDFGAILIFIGIIAMIVISFLDISVSTDYGKVSNLSKMNIQQNYIIIAGVITILGGILFGSGFIVEQIKESTNLFKQDSTKQEQEKTNDNSQLEQNSTFIPKWQCPNCDSIHIKSSSIITYNGFDIYQCPECKQKFKSKS